MGEKKSYMTIQAIAAELGMKAALMEKGQLNTGQIDELTELSKELYERMIVLRYKAFEAMVNPPSLPPVIAETESLPEIVHEPEPEAAAPVIKEERKSSIRFGEPEYSPKQISLIDSIEEIKKMESLESNIEITTKIETKVSVEDQTSLGQKLKKIPLANLKTAIGINQKFLFISTLFNDDKDAYNSAIEKLNGFSSYLEADDFIQNVLKQRYAWQMKNPVAKEFVELVERRYL
jgi:hypothetical protein